MAVLYNVACEMWISLAATTEDVDIIGNVTSACLTNKTFLDDTLLFRLRQDSKLCEYFWKIALFFRETQATITFLQKEYEAALVALTTYYAEVSNFEYRIGKKTSRQPYLDILQLAIDKILHNEEETSPNNSLKERFVQLRKESPEDFRAQKAKYDALVEKGKEKELKDQEIYFMYEAGVNAGMF